MSNLQLEIVKPDGQVLSEAVDEVVVPGALGSFGIRPGHAPLLVELGQGKIEYRMATTRAEVAVAGGFCEVQPDKVTVLAERAELPDEIDVTRAERARDRAEEQLRSIENSGSGEEIERVRRQLQHAVTRLEVAAGGSAPAP